MMTPALRLAADNGRLCFETGRPMKDSNPYRRGTKSHAAFEAEYRAAEARAALSGRGKA